MKRPAKLDALVFVAVLAVALASFRITLAATSRPTDDNAVAFEPMWSLDWHGCTQGGECTPGATMIPSGRFRFLKCTDGGWCPLVTYQWWDPRDVRGYSGPHAWERKELHHAD